MPTRPLQTASYPIPVRQVTILLTTSSRHYLTITPLWVASPSPPSGRTEDFHLQVVRHFFFLLQALLELSSDLEIPST